MRLLHFLLPKLRRQQTARSEYNILTNEATTINNNEISSKVSVKKKQLKIYINYITNCERDPSKPSMQNVLY